MENSIFFIAISIIKQDKNRYRPASTVFAWSCDAYSGFLLEDQLLEFCWMATALGKPIWQKLQGKKHRSTGLGENSPVWRLLTLYFSMIITKMHQSHGLLRSNVTFDQFCTGHTCRVSGPNYTVLYNCGCLFSGAQEIFILMENLPALKRKKKNQAKNPANYF